MELDLHRKRALVTGSSRGIGRAIAEALLREGCSVALNGRNGIDLAATAGQLAGSIAIAGDMTQPAQAVDVVNRAVTELGGLDILICNVGSGRSVPPGNESYEEWQRVFGLNLWSTTNAVEAAKGALTASRGVIVCISSICGVEVIPGAPVTYSAAKAALHAFVRGSARPLGKLGVRINAVAPGNILFEGSVWDKKLAADADGVHAMLVREVAVARLGHPSEIADQVVFLASPRAAFITGTVLTADGGQARSS